MLSAIYFYLSLWVKAEAKKISVAKYFNYLWETLTA